MIEKNSKAFIFHHDDLDGIGGKSVIEYYCDNNNISTRATKLNYSKYPKNYLVDFIKDENLIYIVDISFTEDTVDMLNTLVDTYPNTVVWLDHHQSSIDLLESGTIHKSNFKDIVLDKGRCGCRIAYNYLFNKESAIVTIIDDWDRFQLKDKRTLPFKTFTDSLSEDDLTKDLKTFLTLSSNDSEKNGVLFFKLLEHYIKNGKTVLGYLNGKYKKDLEENSYELTINGIKCIALNIQGPSQIFCGKINKDEYPAAINYYYDGNEFVHSVTSCDENIFNAKAFAEKHGGGGHPKRAGFRTKELLFKKGDNYKW